MQTENHKSNVFLLTVDVEDWFQVDNLKECISHESWPSHELRVEKNTHRLLDLFDSIELEGYRAKPEPVHPAGQSKQKIQATFFVLGWIAKCLPHLVREIHARGHEVASHGFYHGLCTGQDCVELHKDLTDSKHLLENIIGGPVNGYRAPNFSINQETLKIIEDCGFLYDSSYNSFRMHHRYGKITLPKRNGNEIVHRISNSFFEIPVSNLGVGWPMVFRRPASGFVLPWGGGGYFRLLPLWIFKMGMRRILKKDNAYVMYMHPWEVDPEQPRVEQVSNFFKFRHYVNLKSTYSKMLKLFTHFGESRFLSCNEYLQNELNIGHR